MKRPAVTRRRARAAALASAAALTLGLAGCSTMSPVTVMEPYQAADGTNASIPGSGISLNNFLVVSSAAGAPGQVVGAVVNSTPRPVVVTMQADLGTTSEFSQVEIKVPANGITQVGPAGTEFVLTDTPEPPGALITLSANYRQSGGISLSVPVLDATGYYAGYTVAPTTAAPSPTGSPAPSGTSTPQGTATPETTATASDTEAAEPTPSADS